MTLSSNITVKLWVKRYKFEMFVGWSKLYIPMLVPLIPDSTELGYTIPQLYTTIKNVLDKEKKLSSKMSIYCELIERAQN